MPWLDLDTVPEMFKRGAFHFEDGIIPYPWQHFSKDAHADADAWLSGDAETRARIKATVESRPKPVVDIKIRKPARVLKPRGPCKDPRSEHTWQDELAVRAAKSAYLKADAAELMLKGLSKRDIAELLGVSVRAVQRWFK